MHQTATRITKVGRVIVPVTDQDKALDFYTDTLGFELRVDSQGADQRWIEVAPPGAATTIALVRPRGGMFESPGVDTRVSFSSEDVEADHANLLSRGVDADPEILRLGGGVPPMFFFRDPDRNTVQIVQG
jgi:catechol 2,3-dioxygenase-like lactoylglutathione lyase family enzyme